MRFRPLPMDLDAPLLRQLLLSAAAPVAPFHTPGHRRGRGVAPELRRVWGEAMFRADLPELPELDNLFAAEGVIAEAQAAAAEAFGAEASHFLINGSSGGLMAAVLACCGPGDRLLLPRNCHRSLVSACILSGAVPVFLTPPYDPDLGVIGAVTATQVAAALTRHPDLTAVLVVSPTYEGLCADLTAIADLCHRHHLPLIVDAAHGAHHGWHPQLPLSAVQAGADLTVQSTHKTLGALTQAAMLHRRGDRVDAERLARALALVQSSSPSYLLMASLDAARADLQRRGQTLLSQTLALAGQARMALTDAPGLRLLTAGDRPGFERLDPTRLLVNVTAAGWDGFSADEWLCERGVLAELPALESLTFLFSLGTQPEDVSRLVDTLTELARSPGPGAPPRLELPPWPSTATAGRSPRQAFFTPAVAVPRQEAIGRICAETICPYPPGIPVLLPGEEITAESLDYLVRVQASGGVISGCADPELRQLRVLTNLE